MYTFVCLKSPRSPTSPRSPNDDRSVISGGWSYTAIYIYIHTYSYIYIYTYTYTCMHVCMYACMHVCMYVCMYVCTYVCMYVCMYVCICVYIYIYIYTYMTRIYIYTHTYIATHISIYIYIYTYVYIYIYIYIMIILCIRQLYDGITNGDLRPLATINPLSENPQTKSSWKLVGHYTNFNGSLAQPVPSYFSCQPFWDCLKSCSSETCFPWGLGTRGLFLIQRQRGHPGVVLPLVISNSANH